MDDVVAIAIISAGSALLGALLGAIPSVLQYRLRKKEVEEQKITRIHQQTVELLNIYRERVKLLEINKGVYATHEPPLLLYWKFFQALSAVEGDGREISDEVKRIMAEEIRATNKDPKAYGL